MRPTRLALLSLPLLVTTAAARPSNGNGGAGGGKTSAADSGGPGVAARSSGGSGGGGGGGGGGALSKVSGGIGSASRASTPPQGSTTYHPETDRIAELCYDGNGRVIDAHDVDECYYPRIHHSGNVTMIKRRARFEPPQPAATFGFYAGAQKVHDSDGSVALELAVVDRRFRIDGTYARYFERQREAGLLTMTMPTLTGGVRIDDMGSTAVFLEGGVVHVRTDNDVMGDSKLTGPIAGMRVEHALADKISVLGNVQQMWFDNEIRATAARVGVRYKYVQASFRVLDFNVGPPLYGPEVGVRF